MVSVEVLKTIYYGAIYPFISYGVEIWGAAADVHIGRILLLQKRAVRMMFGLGYTESCREVFIREKLLTVHSLYIFKLLTFFIKNKNGFSSCKDIHNHDTRNKDNFYVQRTHLKLTENSPFINGQKLLNRLPDSIKKKRRKGF